MSNRHFRVVAMGAATALLIAACSSAKPTLTFVHVTASPSAAVSDTPTDTPTSASTDTPFTAPTDTPISSPTPVVSMTPTPTAVPSPTGPAGGCLGTADNQAFFVLAAGKVPFQIYCATPARSWYFNGATYTQPNGGTFLSSYKTSAGATFDLKEGAFCTTSAAACSTHVGGALGAASFGDQSGQLYSLGGSAGYAIYVAPGTAHGYTAIGTGMTQAAFVALAASLMQVPKA